MGLPETIGQVENNLILPMHIAGEERGHNIFSRMRELQVSNVSVAVIEDGKIFLL